VRDIAMLVSVEGAVIPGLRRYRSGAHNGSVAAALIIFVKALVRVQVGLDECTSQAQPAMARWGCF
jgi:hypothetical protein